MISNGERRHYFALKKLLKQKNCKKILIGITSKHHRNFYCLRCLHSLATENERECRQKICENKDFCNVVMPSEDTKILEFNQCQKFDKTPFIIYSNLECLTEKINECKNNHENHLQQK